jgi:predicted phage gp36 major capsid-like protein
LIGTGLITWRAFAERNRDDSRKTREELRQDLLAARSELLKEKGEKHDARERLHARDMQILALKIEVNEFCRAAGAHPRYANLLQAEHDS